jgi:hypothetical protein
MSSATTAATITTVSPDHESMSFDIGSQDSQVAHPFVSGNAWFRSMPSTGTRCTVSFNQTLQRYEFVAYTQTGEQASNRLEAYRNRKSTYRPLAEGEHELQSSGTVNEFWGERPVKTGRAGPVTWSYDADKLEAVTTSPTHIMRGHRHQTDRIGNEIRFGAIKRPTSAVNEQYALVAPFSNPAIDSYVYAYEYLVNLANDNDAPLIDFRAGEVYENTLTPGTPSAKPALSKKNSLPLRARYRYHATLEPGGLPAPGSTDIEIDCLGNVSVALSDTAVIGLDVAVPFGHMHFSSGQDASVISQLALRLASKMAGVAVSSLLDTKIESGTDMKISAGTSLDIEATADAIFKSLTLKMTTTATAEIGGGAGLTLYGALGKTGRPVSTQSNCFISGAPFFIDPTLSS